MTITIKDSDGNAIETKEFSSVSLDADMLSVFLNETSFVNLGLTRGGIYFLTVDGMYDNQQAEFLTRQFSISTYQATGTDGKAVTKEGVTNNTMQFRVIG